MVMDRFFWAAADDDDEQMIRLLDEYPVLREIPDIDGDRPLAIVAHDGQLGAVRLLIARGADINARGAKGSTALSLAVGAAHEEVLALLLVKGAHANSGDDNGVTPLMLASECGNLGVVKMLAEHMGGQGLDKVSLDGLTALHWAAFKGHEEVVRFLLFAGADPSIRDNGRDTPRAVAEEYHNTERTREDRARCVAVFQVGPLAR
jgi:ankyrin repeat protein